MPGQGRLGDIGMCPADAHGCVSCPHPVQGKAIGGSGTVFVNGKPALRVSDPGVHAACCGPNQWTAAMGSGTVFYDGLAAHRMGDQQTHCGGVGKLISASADVIVGG